MTLKGRHWVMLWLVVALGALGGVNLRQTIAYGTVRDLRDAREERAALEARRGELERRIFQASGRQVLVPRAAAGLGLHEPGAGEITVFVMPADLPGGLPAEVASGAEARRDTVRKAPAPRPRAAARAPARKPAARRPPARSTPRRN
jgi:hypothetical protein